MNQIIEKILESRNLTVSQYNELNQNLMYNELHGLDQMSSYIDKCYYSQNEITILPDFDMDGISAGSLSFAGFSELGLKVNLFVPDPKKGYGFSGDTILELLRRYPNTKYLFTCDTGITCYEGIEVAKALGLTVLLSDHHRQKTSEICADVIVNPNGFDDEHLYFKDYCGATVVYKILQYYCKHYRPDKLQQIEALQVLAGIGTISDLMELSYDNRVIVSNMTQYMSDILHNRAVFLQNAESPYYKNLFRNFSYLMRTETLSIGLDGEYFDEEYIGYYFAPMMNSIKRLEEDVREAFLFFFQNNTELSQKSLYRLKQFNIIRKENVKEFYEKLDSFSDFIFISEAKKGILGLLAQKQMSSTNLPTIVLNKNLDGSYSGSARSPVYYPLNTILSDVRITCEGHQHSFGIFIENEMQLELVHQKIESTFTSYLNDYIEETKNLPHYDVLLSKDDVTGLDSPIFDYFYNISYLKPFGRGFPDPIFAFECDLSDGNLIFMGKEKNHAKLEFDYFSCILFFYEQFEPDFTLDDFKTSDGTYTGKVRFIGNLKVNCFRDSYTINLLVTKVEIL